jgi:uncharacterized protein (TIGR02246 family)
MKAHRFAFLPILLLVAFGCAQKADLEAERTAIRTADAQWAQAAAAKDATEAAKFVAVDGTMMPPNSPAITGADAIAAWMSQTLATPGFAISWEMTAVDVAASGDLAYSLGTNRVQMQMPDGTLVGDSGKGLTIWKKQADGTWKVVVDIFNSDTPIVPPLADTTGATGQ